MSETRFPTRKICAHPVQKIVSDGTGTRQITVRCGKLMDTKGRVVKHPSEVIAGAYIESLEHGLFCPDGHKAGKK